MLVSPAAAGICWSLQLPLVYVGLSSCSWYMLVSPAAAGICWSLQLQLVYVGLSSCSWYMLVSPAAAGICWSLQLPLVYVGLSSCSWYMLVSPAAAGICWSLQLQLVSAGLPAAADTISSAVLPAGAARSDCAGPAGNPVWRPGGAGVTWLAESPHHTGRWWWTQSESAN